MGGNFSERSQKKGTKKIVPKENVIMRGVQTDRKKKTTQPNQTKSSGNERARKDETNPHYKYKKWAKL